MSLLFFDGFETYATGDLLKDWATKIGSPTINATGGRRSGGSLSVSTVSGATNISKTLPSALSTIVIGFAFKPSAVAASAKNIAKLLDGGTNQLEIKLNTDATLSITRNGTALGTSSASLSIDNWQYVELKANIHDTTGSYELRLDGVNILSATSVDTKNTANASVNQVMLGVDTNPGASIIWLYDDFYVLNTAGSAPNNDFLGDIRIDAIYPTADGNYTDFTPSAGTDHYALVDDATPDSADYNSSSTAGHKDSYVMSDPPALSGQIIHGLRVKAVVSKDDAGDRSIKVGVRSNTTDNVSAAQSLSTSDLYYSNMHEVDPATGLAWTASGVNNVQALVEVA